MILRDPKNTKTECQFIADLYDEWPDSNRGPIYPEDVKVWIKRFQTRDGEKGLVGELNGESIGYILYEVTHGGQLAQVYELLVRKDLQNQGHGSAMVQVLTDKLISEGVLAAEFDALPGAIAEKTKAGGFEKIGEGVGEDTGLPIVVGRVTA